MKTNFFSKLRENKHRKEAENARNKHSHRHDYLLNDKTPFAVTEGFRNLKASLAVAVPKTDEKRGVSFLVTSDYPEEGKTTVSVNLAMMFAMSNVKVVLIDADIRKGRISKFFKEHHKPGLSDYLSGQAKLDEILHQTSQNENLYVIYQGTSSPRPYELLESEAMKKLAEELRSRFDYIIYDTPPVKLVSDALAVVPVTDGTLLVCRHMTTYLSDIKSSLETLKFAKANLLGVVVNDYYAASGKLTGSQKKYYYSYYKYGYDNKNSTPPQQVTYYTKSSRH